MASLQYTNLTAPIPEDFEGTVTQPASGGAGVPVYVVFTPNPLLPTYTESSRITPSTEDDVLYGMFITDSDSNGNASVTVDGKVKFIVNNVDTNIIWGNISQTNYNLRNPVKFKNSPITVNRNAKLQIMFIPSTANTSDSAITQTIHFKYMRVPADYKGQVILPA